MESYLNSIRHQFEYYKQIGEKSIEQLEDKDIFFQADPESNSIATIVTHLAGNMLSRFTDFFTTDGEKSWRDRDSEFNPKFTQSKEVMDYWEKGWNCFLSVIHSLQPEDLEKTILIRGEQYTVIGAVNRQLAHYPYHIGQIIYIAKSIKKEEWQTLSIPKNKSGEYNFIVFSRHKK